MSARSGRSRIARLVGGADPAPERAGSLAEIRSNAGRERLLDMQVRLRPYRTACFLVLAVALVSVSPEVGWWWVLPLCLGLGAFRLADALMANSRQPGLWVSIAWAMLPLLLAEAVIVTGGAESPVLMWFALPAVTLGTRFTTRGIVAGTAYVVVLLLLSSLALDPAAAAAHRQEVIAAVALVISIVVLSGALVESDRAHRRRATIDPLTGLLNRNALEQRLAEMEAGGRPPEEGAGGSALLLCDLDHFKRVNDQLGHAAGDAVLQDVAYTMRAALRAGDSIYRIGGEEILIVLPRTGREEAAEVAERVRVAVRERRPGGVRVTVSVGVAVTGPGRSGAEELVRRADEALYAAKAGGRDRVSFAGEAPPAERGGHGEPPRGRGIGGPAASAAGALSG